MQLKLFIKVLKIIIRLPFADCVDQNHTKDNKGSYLGARIKVFNNIVRKRKKYQ